MVGLASFRGLSRRRQAVIAAAVAGVLLLAALGTWTARGGSPDEGRPLPSQAAPGPVILIPGYGGGSGGLEFLAERLRTTGRTATVVPLPDDGTGDLHEQADVVEAYVAEALDSGAASVDLVAHSAGGVVARVWLDEHDGARKARRIVTLGSPHHGASLAAAGAALLPGACPIACQQLVPGSALFAELSAPVPSPPMWLSLWTTEDDVVTPPESAVLDGALSLAIQAVCPGATAGHAELPTDPAVVGLVLAAVGPAEFTVPDACPTA